MQKGLAKEQTNTSSFTDFCLMYNWKSEEYLQCKHKIWEAQKPWKSIKIFREMANLSKKILPKSSENDRSQSEIFRGPTKKNFRQIASKLTELEHFQILVIFLNWLGNVSDWCRIRHICVGFVSNRCRIGVGSDTFVSDRCRIGVGSVSDWCRMCRVVSASVGHCRLVSFFWVG